MAVLRTQADLLGAEYTRLLTWVAVVIGAASAVASLVDANQARTRYHSFRVGHLWEWLFGFPLSQGYEAFLMRGIIITATALATGILSWILMRFVPCMVRALST